MQHGFKSRTMEATEMSACSVKPTNYSTSVKWNAVQRQKERRTLCSDVEIPLRHSSMHGMLLLISKGEIIFVFT